MKKVVVVLVCTIGLCMLLFWWFFVRHTTVQFCLIGQMDGPREFRTSDNAPFDPQGWVWYSICEDPYSGFDSREIQSYLDQNGIVLDTDRYSYIIVRGFTLEALSFNRLNSAVQAGHRGYIGYVKLGTDCEPSTINIYQIDKRLIVPSRQYSTSAPFVEFN